MDTEIVRQETTPGYLLELAITKDLDVDKLQKLLELQRSWQADNARKEFFAALSDFQNQCPDLRKNKEVNFGNGKAAYHYAPLADIDRQIKKLMRECGLAKRWEIEDNKEDIKVTCLITHIAGHTEKTTMQGNPDTSGGKNAIQARGSVIEYMKRYTLIGSLGLTTADNDIDGRLPDYDMDKLHKDFMEVYNQLIQIDSSYTKYDVANWKGEPTGKNYIKAIGELRKLLAKEKLK